MEIDLIVRGMCCLRPGIPGLSDNIRVRSIVGRFLEHTRIYYFLHDGEEPVWCASADWMERNLINRVETSFPIIDEKLKARVIKEGLNIYLRDNSQAWLMQADGSYVRVENDPENSISAQQWLLERLT